MARRDEMKGLGVTFYKQGIGGALSRKKPSEKAVVKPKARPASAKAMSSGKPGESSMARTEAMRPTVKAVRDESRMAKAEAARPVTRQSSGPMSRNIPSPVPMDKAAKGRRGLEPAAKKKLWRARKGAFGLSEYTYE